MKVFFKISPVEKRILSGFSKAERQRVLAHGLDRAREELDKMFFDEPREELVFKPISDYGDTDRIDLGEIPTQALPLRRFGNRGLR